MVRWWAGAWSSCDDGTQLREVARVDLEGNVVNAADCVAAGPAPVETQPRP